MRNDLLRAVLALSVLVMTFPCRALAEDESKSLVGTWKLSGWVVQVVGDGSQEPFGPNPKGRLVLTADGYWMIIITGADRHSAKTSEDKVALFDSLLAYSGKYGIEGEKITVKVDMSANEVFSGSNQIQTRFFKLEGDKLTIRTPEMSSAALPGKKVVGTNVFERER